MDDSKPAIITVVDLKTYFYESLMQANCSHNAPVPNETLIYSSNVLERFGHSEEFFELKDGKVREKILGEILLSAPEKSLTEQQQIYRDVADTSLFLCGYFSESISTKLVDVSYYHQIGIAAYSRLNTAAPNFLDIPGFYEIMAKSFNNLSEIISVVASKDQSDPHKHLLVG